MPGSPPHRPVHTVVLGAGAAGLLCAAEIGKRGRSVVLLDAADRPGRKILISGGGRCNFTNLHTRPENFLSGNPHFAKSALARYTSADFVALVERYRIPYHEKTLGQLFCDGSAQAIVSMLEEECRAGHVDLRLRTEIRGLAQSSDGYLVQTSAGEIAARNVVVATGGLSIPKMGATGIGHTIARSLGLEIVPPRPALVPLTFGAADLAQWADLSGVSVDAVATASGTRSSGRHRPPTFREKLLFTHRGLSGPVALQISSYWSPGNSLTFDLAPGRTVFTDLLEAGPARDRNLALQCLRPHLPVRLADRWLDRNLPTNWKNPSVHTLEQRLHSFTVQPEGTEGYSKAEVTAGGVSTAELDSTSMQARRAPGVFFVGEVVDVTGHLGGHNFQWAWASAVAAAAAVSQLPE